MLAGTNIDTDGESESDSNECWAIGPLCESEFRRLVGHIDSEYRPKVFALVERFGRYETELFAWGVQVGDHASVFAEDGRVLAHCDSADGAQRMFSIIRDVVLVWPSPPVTEPVVTD